MLIAPMGSQNGVGQFYPNGALSDGWMHTGGSGGPSPSRFLTGFQ